MRPYSRSAALTNSQSRAHDVMGNRMVLPEAVASCFGVALSLSTRFRLFNVPFSDQFLADSKRASVLIPGMPLTLKQMQTGQQSHRFVHDFQFDNKQIYHELPFASNEVVDPCWHLVRIAPINTEASLSYEDQAAQIDSIPDETPPPALLVFVRLVVWHALGKRTFSPLEAWSSEPLRVITKRSGTKNLRFVMGDADQPRQGDAGQNSGILVRPILADGSTKSAVLYPERIEPPQQ